jgi:hypothetical protein
MIPGSEQVIDFQKNPKVWLDGPAGCGKTSAGVRRLRALLESGVPAESILVLVPQRTLGEPYQKYLRSNQMPAGGQVDVLTLNSLAQRSILLFWPLVAGQHGFASVSQTPTFLTIETAQYHLVGLVREKMVHEGYFSSLNIDPNRLFSQLLDNLNKSALVGFPYTEIGQRLKSAWDGSSSQLRVFDQAQDCLHLFRRFCLDHNLLDFSLQIELFTRQLWPALLCRRYLQNRYRHLICDNLEEDTPATHDVLREWLPELDTALLITDEGGGYRRFLGADPASANETAATLPVHTRMEAPIALPAAFSHFIAEFAVTMRQPVPHFPVGTATDLPERMSIQSCRFFPQMLDWTADAIADLVQNQGVSPDRIAVVAPFLPDTLRFSLGQRLAARGVPYRTVRPSRSLREEPLVQCLLTLAKLAYPTWQLIPHKQDVIQMLQVSIAGLDPVRASLLGEIVYRKTAENGYLTSFDPIVEKEKARITYLVGERYQELRKWIEDYQSLPAAEADLFFQRIFGELLTRPGFGFRDRPEAGEVTANLIESAAKFRQNMQPGLAEGGTIACEFVTSLEQGLVAAQFLSNYQTSDQPAVLVAPAHTFIMQNQVADTQFWLDIGSNGWYERLEQPLTHPYVLSRGWPADRRWHEEDDTRTNREALFHLIEGMLRRCTRKVNLVYLEVNEQGFEQQGQFLKDFHLTMMHLQRREDEHAA